MSNAGKIESGAQLLARLGPRPTLHGLGALELLGFEPSPGDILEIYGGEGVGKTELLLHLVCNAILPMNNSHQCESRPHTKTEVIWVDCDLKFSILRLAVLFEQGILRASSPPGDSMDKGREGRGSLVDNRVNISNTGWAASVSGPETENVIHGTGSPEPSSKRSASDTQVGEIVDSGDQTFHKKTVRLSQKRKVEVLQDDSVSVRLTSTKDSHIRAEIEDRDHHQLIDRNGNESNSTESGSVNCVRVSEQEVDHKLENEEDAEDVEKKVEECLKRVHVAHCTSSQQLICTLHSLESLVAANHNISVIVIDSVSAFFWSDKCNDFNHSASILHKNMSHIVSILKKLASTYGLLVLATKQGLVKSRTAEQDNNIVSPAKQSADLLGKDGHVEFLGQAWSGVVTHRLLCSRSGNCQGDIRKVLYTLSCASWKKQFIISESGIHVASTGTL